MAQSNTFEQASTNYKEAFALFDKRGNQRVALDSLGDLLRACGQNPTLAEIRDLEKNVGSDCTASPPNSVSTPSASANCLFGSFLELGTHRGIDFQTMVFANARPPTVDFETFSKILNRPGGFRDPGEPEEYCRGFQVFDKDMTGFIGVGQLRYILTNLGEKMTDDEVNELLKAVDTSGNGEVNYTGMFCNSTYRHLDL